MEALQLKGVQRVVADQCQLRQQTETVSNAPGLLQALSKRCLGGSGLCSRSGGGGQAKCFGKKATQAAIFQEKLRMAILCGCRAELMKDRRMRPGELGVVESSDGFMLDGCEEIQDYIASVTPEPKGVSSFTASSEDA